MLKMNRIYVLLGVAAALGVVYGVVEKRERATVAIARGADEAKGTTNAAPPTAVQPVAAPPPADTQAATPPIVVAPVAAPVDPLASDDPFVQRDAIEKALAQKDVSALPKIQKVDLTNNGYVAAAAIDAVGKLAALAPEPARRDAVRTLSTWLAQESKRGTNDAVGNVSILVDSLADTKSSEAIAPLVAALDSASQPLHIETRIVQSLDALSAKSAAPSVQRFAARVAALTPSDDLEKALATEALEAANTALAKWR